MNAYQRIAAQGRGGDTELAFTSARDREMLRRMGGSGTVNPYTGLKEYKGGGDEPDTSPTIDTPNPTPQFTMAHPEFASYKNLYRMEHGLARDAELPEGWSRTSPQDRAMLYMKYNNVTPDARNAYYDYITGLGGRVFTDEQKYNTEMRRSDIMQDLIPKADYAYLGQHAPFIQGGQINTNIPSYGGVTYGGQYIYRGAAEGGYIKKDDDMNYESLASKGRGGDSDLAFTNAREREMLQRMGGAGTVNPYTGLKEYKGGGSTSASKPVVAPTYDASTIDQSLTPVTSIQTEPVVTETPTLRTVPTTDALAPSGGSELSRLMRMYGVSSASANPYSGIDKPTAPEAFTGTAPTALSGQVTQDQIDAYNAARNAYNASVGDYNTSVNQYNTDLNQYGLDQAKYDQYINEYNARMQQPMSIYNQAQFGYTGPQQDNILLSPTYADGGEVNLEDIELPTAKTDEPVSDFAALQARYSNESKALNDLMDTYIKSPKNENLSKAQMFFKLASAFAAPTKTKQGFMESVGNAAGALGEYAGAEQERAQNLLKMQLEAQKLRRDMAKDELTFAAKLREGAPGAYTDEDYTNARQLQRLYSEVNPVTGEQRPLLPIELFLPDGVIYQRMMQRLRGTATTPTGEAVVEGGMPTTPPVEGDVLTAPSNEGGTQGLGTTFGSNTPFVNPTGSNPKADQVRREELARGRAESQLTREQEAENAKSILALVNYNPETGEDDVSQLLEESTGGGASKLHADVMSFFDAKTQGDMALGQLQAIESKLLMQATGGDLGGQVSDEDVKRILAGFGFIGDGDRTRATRLAAWQKFKANQVKKAGAPAPKTNKKEDSPSKSDSGQSQTWEAAYLKLPPTNDNGWVLYIDPVNKTAAYVNPDNPNEFEEVQ